MSCDAHRELISADLDGEATESERAELAAHLATCEVCTAFAADAAALHRASRIAPAAAIPDLTDAILERASVGPPTTRPSADAPAVPSGRRARRRARRSQHDGRGRVAVLAFQYGLLVVALLMVVLAVPELLAPSSDAVHTSRHLGGWDVAFAIGLVLAALQPWRARGLLPMAAALAGVMVVTAVIDIAHGSTPGMAEGTHLLEVFGLVFLWLLSRSIPTDERTRRGRPIAAAADAAVTPMARLRALPSRFGLTEPPAAPGPAMVRCEPATASASAPDVRAA